ncbi:MAG TPA: NAD-dependent epimerase/dehydratase family protein [Elusimicrobiota bacterium]|nr:NAD-dependent epimerase/dehydratase family protein [Elusimicrobiota bacterium]
MSFYRGKKVLVTGGTGLIGRPLVEQLMEQGARVRVASLDSPDRCPPNAEFVKANLVYWNECQKVVKGMDLVFNVAGIKGAVGLSMARPASFMVPHLLFNTHMMEAARQADVERYLYVSSIAVYPAAEVFREDDAFQGPPQSSDHFPAYAKRVGELQAQAYIKEFGWERIAIVRPANVYGPGDNFDPQTGMVISALIARIVSGEDPLVVWGDGSSVRDFIYSKDCARGMLLAMEKGANGIPLNLGSGTGYRIRDVVETLCSIVAKPPRVQWDASRQSGDKVRLMDMTRARSVLGFETRYSLEQGLRETYEWFVSNAPGGGGRYNVFEQKKYID